MWVLFVCLVFFFLYGIYEHFNGIYEHLNLQKNIVRQSFWPFFSHFKVATISFSILYANQLL